MSEFATRSANELSCCQTPTVSAIDPLSGPVLNGL